MPRLASGKKVLRGHSQYVCSPLTEEFRRILEKCGSIKGFRLGSYKTVGARHPDITLGALSTPGMLFTRLRDSVGTFTYHVTVKKGIPLVKCYQEITKRIKELKSGMFVKVVDGPSG